MITIMLIIITIDPPRSCVRQLDEPRSRTVCMVLCLFVLSCPMCIRQLRHGRLYSSLRGKERPSKGEACRILLPQSQTGNYRGLIYITIGFGSLNHRGGGGGQHVIHISMAGVKISKFHFRGNNVCFPTIF